MHVVSYEFSLSTDYTSCIEGLSALINIVGDMKGYTNCYGRQSHNIPASYTEQYQQHPKCFYLFYPASLQNLSSQVLERQILQKKAEPGKSSWSRNKQSYIENSKLKTHWEPWNLQSPNVLIFFSLHVTLDYLWEAWESTCLQVWAQVTKYPRLVHLQMKNKTRLQLTF